MMNSRLRLISASKRLVINATDGRETLARATDVFRYIDSNFGRWNCNTGDEFFVAAVYYFSDGRLGVSRAPTYA
jgi:hypothetical protein